MDKISETLKQYYDAFINQPRQLAFYTGLADYVSYVLETPVLKAITDDVMRKKEEMYDELDCLETKALEEMQAAKKKLLKIIKDNKVDPAMLSQHLQTTRSAGGSVLEHMEKYEKGEIGISGFKSSVLESYLFDIAANLARLGYGKDVQQFVMSNTEYGHYFDDPEAEKTYRVAGNIHGNFIFSQAIIERIRQQARIERCEEYELWGAFNALLKLHEAHAARSKGLGPHNVMETYLTGNKGRNREENKELVEIIWIFEDLGSLAVGDDIRTATAQKLRLWYLDEDQYKGFASRVHTHLLKELIKRSKEPIPNGGFSVVDDKLLFNGKEVIVAKSKNTRPYFLLKILLEDPDKLWNYDEIWEGLFKTPYPKTPDNPAEAESKKIYNAAYDLNKIIATQTAINDFVDATMTTIRIRQKYLPLES